ncbi:MAG: secretin N-terminal domain-containing protein [Fuerstiella sp.]
MRIHVVPIGLMAACLVFSASSAIGQTVRRVEVGKNGTPVVVEQPVGGTAESGSDESAAKSGKDASQKPGSADADKEKSSETSSEKPGDKPDDKKAGVVKRPLKSDESVAPISDEVQLTESGMVTFDMKGQPWEAVLQWLADASKLSLDWQELPGDTLNLTTTRSYSLEEARDIINRHLLARGYTMVLNGELLSVLKIGDIKSSLVPRIAPEDLEGQMDHTLCKVSFDLNWLIADEAVEELAPLLSKAGTISKLSRTNRLEVMDTAASLRDIYRILQSEQSDAGQEQLVRTFRLEYRRASEVIELLRTLLGLENDGGGRGGGGSMGDVGQITNMMRQMQQQLQQMGNSGNRGGGGGGGQDPKKTRLVLNQRENMILVQAAPDQMAIIDQAITQIDVPVEASNSLLQNVNKMKIYRLETVDPQTLVDLLQELGDMGPGTVLKVDKDKKSIVAFANLADHLTITTLVERLDQSGRQVEVIPLRRLDAEYVAGTIRALMAPPPKQENNSRYGYYSRYSSQPEQEETREFKVEADIENNRLLVYANKVEMDEIRLLLQKLGEIPDPDAADDGIRVFELGPDEDPGELMERIKRLWRRSNELKTDIPEPQKRPNSESDDGAEAVEDDSVTDDDDLKPADRIQVWPPPRKMQPVRSVALPETTADEFFARLTEANRTDQSVAASPGQPKDAGTARTSKRPLAKHSDDPQQTEAETASHGAWASSGTGKSAGTWLPVNDNDVPNDAPPIRFSTTADGQLIVSSDDPAALRDVEDLMKRLVRPLPKYRIFYLKYATPSWVTLNLEDYFKAEEETESGFRYDPYWGIMPSSQKKSGAATLGRRRQPQFIYDNFTSTILVRGADRRQLQTIEDLIKVYDVPEPADTRSMRVTKIFKLQNSKAEVVAQAVKDVFRDLLSSNDKALEKKDGEKTQTRVYSYFGGEDEDDGESPIRFKGLLSIGVDSTSDTLVVSSTASLMDIISELVEELDKAADQASTVQVLKIDPTVDITLLQEKLGKALSIARPQQNQPNGKNGRQPVNGVPVGVQAGNNE